MTQVDTMIRGGFQGLRDDHHKILDEQLTRADLDDYKKGIELLSAKGFDAAKTEFKIVIKKYPKSLLVNNSRNKIIAINKELKKLKQKVMMEEKKRKKGINATLSRLKNSPEKYLGKYVNVRCAFGGIEKQNNTIDQHFGEYVCDGSDFNSSVFLFDFFVVKKKKIINYLIDEVGGRSLHVKLKTLIKKKKTKMDKIEYYGEVEQLGIINKYTDEVYKIIK